MVRRGWNLLITSRGSAFRSGPELHFRTTRTRCLLSRRVCVEIAVVTTQRVDIDRPVGRYLRRLTKRVPVRMYLFKPFRLARVKRPLLPVAFTAVEN